MNHQRQDGTAGDAIEAVDLAATTKADANRSGDGVNGDLVDGIAANGVDAKHGSFALVDVISLQGQAGGLCPPCASASGVHPHRCLKGVVGVQIIVCIGALASDATINGEAEHGGSDGAPLCLGQGHGQGVQG